MGMDREEVQQATIKAVETFFAEDDWNYEYEEDRQVFRTGVKIRSKLGSLRVIIVVSETGVSVIGTLPMKADEGSRQQVAEFTTRANYGLRFGNFEMDMEDGEVRYKVFHSTLDAAPTPDLVKHMMYLMISMVDRYGDEMLMVMFNMKTAEEAVEAAENADD